MQQEIQYLENLVSKGGPDLRDYTELNKHLDTLSKRLSQLPKSELDSIADKVMGESFGTDTMQGLAFQKPHGYAGDFEIIERIYCQQVSDNENVSKWDQFFHQSPAAKAVINRKSYFKKLISNHALKNGTASILNVASGPARDLHEYFMENPYSQVSFECIDQDKNAISFASNRCKRYMNRIKFHNQNALRFLTDKQFDLVWSAGLFDYFDDETFVKALVRFSTFAKSGGEIVIGNFCDSNPAQAYMDLFDWKLHHRSANKLTSLAVAAGFDESDVTVESEEEKVNLFMRIKKK